MNNPIIPRSHFRALGRAAFEAGHSRNSHGLNWHAAALVDWHAGWDEAAAEQQEEATA